MAKINEDNKVFQVNNSYGIELSKSNMQSLNLTDGDVLEKNVSDDGTYIIFSKKEAVDAKTKQMIDDIFHENADLIEALKDLNHLY